MNDNFLYRMRQPPRPEFLAQLKSRLDRQPSRAARRPGFVVGLLVGLLAAGGAFALYLHAYRHPTDTDGSQVKATPLAPAWLPTHPHLAPTEPAPSGGSAVESSPGQQATTAPESAAQTRTFTFVAAQQSLVADMLSTVDPHQVLVKAPHYSISDSLQHLCDGTGAYDFPDMVQLNRRLTAEEYRTCIRNGPSAIVEQKLGYQATLLARSKLLTPLRLTARDVFLALAKYVPDPQRSGEVIANPYTNWREVDPALPSERIEFKGPNLLFVLDKLPAYLLLSAGCNTFPWIAALRDTDEGRYREICQTVRTDGIYQEAYLDSSWAQDYLAQHPTAIGIFAGIPTLDEKLAVIPVDGVVPNRNTLAAGNYPLALTLYLYLDKKRINSMVNSFVLSMVSQNASDRRSPTYWGFIPLDSAEQNALRNADEGERFKELHF